jgi:hypothetical protein
MVMMQGSLGDASAAPSFADVARGTIDTRTLVPIAAASSFTISMLGVASPLSHCSTTRVGTLIRLASSA